MEEINNIFQSIETIKSQFLKLEQEKKDYVKNKRQEEFVDDEITDESELLLQGENILDRKSEQKQRIDNIIKLNNEIQQNLHVFQHETTDCINEINKWINEEDKIVINSINETIVTIKEIRERKADKEIKKSPKRKERIEEENQIENNQLEEMWSEYKSERKEIEKRREKERENNYLN